LHNCAKTNHKQLAFRILIFLFSIFSPFCATAQRSVALEFSYGVQVPIGRLTDRFGSNFVAEMGTFLYPADGSGWQLGLSGGLLFGDRVKEDVLKSLRTSQGFLYGNDKSVANIQLRMRGWRTLLVLGKDWQLNEVSGIQGRLGGGYLSHKIRIQDDPQTYVPQVHGDYKRGYDRLEGGPLLYAWTGYRYKGGTNNLNFSIGLEGTLAFTKGQRSFQFDLRQPYLDWQASAWVGLKATWVLTVLDRSSAQNWY
jgi:hypothetical protein